MPETHGLFHRVLNEGLVEEGQQLLGHSLGNGEESGAQTGGGNYGFSYGLGKATMGAILTPLPDADNGREGTVEGPPMSASILIRPSPSFPGPTLTSAIAGMLSSVATLFP